MGIRKKNDKIVWGKRGKRNAGVVIVVIKWERRVGEGEREMPQRDSCSHLISHVSPTGTTGTAIEYTRMLMHERHPRVVHSRAVRREPKLRQLGLRCESCVAPP